MSITGLMRRLSLIGIDAIWQLSLGCSLMRTIASFLPITGYLNFINGPYKSRFVANSSACTTTKLSILLTSCFTAIKNHVIKYCTTVYERNGNNLYWSIKNSGKILNKLKSRGFLTSGLSTYDFSTLYTTLPHNLIKEKLAELNKQLTERNHFIWLVMIKKVSKGAKISNRYNQVPHLTQDTNGKVTNSQQNPQTRAKRSALSQQVTTKHYKQTRTKTMIMIKMPFFTSEPKRYKLWSYQKMCVMRSIIFWTKYL